MRFTGMTLNRRLRLALGRRICIEAPGIRTESGRLQRVFPRFIRVTGQLFVQRNLERIILLQSVCHLPPCRVVVCTTYEETFPARLVQIGIDFVELVEGPAHHRKRTLIPLGQLIGIERE